MDRTPALTTEPISVASGGTRLHALADLAARAGATTLASDARSLADRLAAGLFYVACVGQSKRGKSTLLNALLGDAVLPMGVVPVTSVVTVVRHGARRQARVRFRAGDWQPIEPADIAGYVSEEQYPENRKGVAAVEVLLPSAMLAEGMCLVDTPGLGSVFLADSEATRAFLPHIDVALVVLGSDPPISADELQLVEDISRQCHDLLFVLNKADRFTDAEREQSREFTRRILAERLGMDTPAFFEVSATEALAGAPGNRDWPQLIELLGDLARRAGGGLVRAAETRGAAHVAERIRRHLEEERDALLRPVEDSERRVGLLRTAVAGAERSLNDLSHLLAAEEARLGRVFTARREEFLFRAVAEGRREHADALRLAPDRRGPALRARGLDLAHRIAERKLDAWLSEWQPQAEALYVEASGRFTDLAEEHLKTLASSGDLAMAGLPGRVNPEAGFRARSRLYYTYLMAATARSPLGWMLDVLRTREGQLRALDRELGAYLEELLIVNANRIENDFRNRVLESRRGLEAEVRSCLTDVTATAEKALERAKAQLLMGSGAVQRDLERVGSQLRELDATMEQGKGSRSEQD